jgi:hypothetical protein
MVACTGESAHELIELPPLVNAPSSITIQKTTPLVAVIFIAVRPPPPLSAPCTPRAFPSESSSIEGRYGQPRLLSVEWQNSHLTHILSPGLEGPPPTLCEKAVTLGSIAKNFSELGPMACSESACGGH